MILFFPKQTKKRTEKKRERGEMKGIVEDQNSTKPQKFSIKDVCVCVWNVYCHEKLFALKKVSPFPILQ